MRNISGAFTERLGSGATTLARCWKLSRRDGLVLGFTEHDAPLEFDGTRFEPEAGLAAGAIEQSTGLSVDSHEVAGALRSDAISEEDLRLGRYTDAEVEMWLVDWELPENRILLSRGFVSQVRQRGHAFEAEISSLSDRLNRPVGRAFLHSCPLRLGEPACGVDLSLPARRGEGAVIGVPEPGTVRVSGLESREPGAFSNGVLTWTSGPASGSEVQVKSHRLSGTAVILTFWGVPGQAPAIGDAFTLRVGCDKTATTCRARFGNIVNFRGHPFMPGDDWVTSYPTSGGPHDGGSLFRS